MPRNLSGVYSLPSGNPVVAGTVIEDTWANPTMSDIANEITLSLPRSGAAPMTGPLILSADATLALEPVTLQQSAVALALKANLASPEFTGAPSLPTGTTGTTQTAGDSSTKLATTKFVTDADNFKANLASPTFSGTPSLPTGTTATTQSAGDSSTKLATTAFVTTADNLKANLASPTFSGTPSLPTGTTATTQTALDNSTKLATTAYADNVHKGPVFRAILGANFGPMTSNADIDLSPATITEVFDTASAHSGFVFTAPIAGYYQFNGYVLVAGSGDSLELAEAWLSINGTKKEVGNISYKAGAALSTVSSVVSGVHYLAASGTCKLVVRAVGAGTLTLTGATFSGALVRLG